MIWCGVIGFDVVIVGSVGIDGWWFYVFVLVFNWVFGYGWSGWGVCIVFWM